MKEKDLMEILANANARKSKRNFQEMKILFEIDDKAFEQIKIEHLIWSVNATTGKWLNLYEFKVKQHHLTENSNLLILTIDKKVA